MLKSPSEIERADQDGGNEHFACPWPFERFVREAGTTNTGQTDAVQMCGQPLVQPRELMQSLARSAHKKRAHLPQMCRFVDVLGDDFDDRVRHVPGHFAGLRRERAAARGDAGARDDERAFDHGDVAVRAQRQPPGSRKRRNHPTVFPFVMKRSPGKSTWSLRNQSASVCATSR
jgi:hypothetical protein